MVAISELGRLRQEHQCEFGASLGYIMICRLSGLYSMTLSQNTKKSNIKFQALEMRKVRVKLNSLRSSFHPIGCVVWEPFSGRSHPDLLEDPAKIL